MRGIGRRNPLKGLRLMAYDARRGTRLEPESAEDTAGGAHGPLREMDEADRPRTIGEVARQFGVTLRTLRFYESKRLLTPRRQGATRLYMRRDCERIALILTGRRLGFTLAEIRDLIRTVDGNGLGLTRDQCMAQINLLERRKRGIELAIAELRKICTSFYRKLLEDDARSSRD